MPAHARPLLGIPLLALTIAAISVSACNKKPKETAQAAQPPAPTADPNNAAPVYAALHDRIGKDFLDSVSPWGADKPRADAAALKAHKADIDDLIAATRLPECDFGVTWDYNGQAPQYFGQMRRLYKLLQADAQRCLSEANPVGAGARAAAMLRMARHQTLHAQSSMDLLGTVITSEAALKMLNERIDAGMLPDQVRAEVAEAIAKLGPPDFLGARRTMLNDMFQETQALRAGKIPKDLDGNALSQADQNKAAEQIEIATTKVAAAFDSPDPQAAFASLGSGASGYAQTSLSVRQKEYESVQRVQQQAVAAKKKFGP